MSSTQFCMLFSSGKLEKYELEGASIRWVNTNWKIATSNKQLVDCIQSGRDE